MNKVTVTLEMPVKYHCRHCGYEEHGVPDSHPALCPSCGDTAVSSGYRRLRENRWHRDIFPHQYDLLGSRSEYQYYFEAASGERIGRAFPYDNMVPSETTDAVKAMDELLYSIDKHYMFCGVKKELEKFRETLIAALPLHQQNHRKNRLHEMEQQLYEMSLELEELNDM